MIIVVKCLLCGVEVCWMFENKFCFFCLVCCKQFDFGVWVVEKYWIGGVFDEGLLLEEDGMDNCCDS